MNDKEIEINKKADGAVEFKNAINLKISHNVLLFSSLRETDDALVMEKFPPVSVYSELGLQLVLATNTNFIRVIPIVRVHPAWPSISPIGRRIEGVFKNTSRESNEKKYPEVQKYSDITKTINSLTAGVCISEFLLISQNDVSFLL